jgi:hypothetical protein
MSKLSTKRLAEIERRALSDPLMADALAEIQRLKRAILFDEGKDDDQDYEALLAEFDEAQATRDGEWKRAFEELGLDAPAAPDGVAAWFRSLLTGPAPNGNGHGVEITGRLHQASALPGRRTARYITLSLVTNHRADEFLEATRGKLSRQVTVRIQ